MKTLRILAVATLALAGFAWTYTAGPQPATAATVQGMGPDTTGAAIWSHLQSEDYQNSWDLYPGTTELYEGTEPHGMLLTTYVNDVAHRALERNAERMPAGAIIVKENYMPNGNLAAITVMYKRPGYNADHNDWFFSKHLPDGSLDQAPNGMRLQGRVPGCQACHSAQKQNDYLFTGNM